MVAALDPLMTTGYCRWQSAEAQVLSTTDTTLEESAARVAGQDITPAPRTGRQEYLENLGNRFV